MFSEPCVTKTFREERISQKIWMGAFFLIVFGLLVSGLPGGAGAAPLAQGTNTPTPTTSPLVTPTFTPTPTATPVPATQTPGPTSTPGPTPTTSPGVVTLVVRQGASPWDLTAIWTVVEWQDGTGQWHTVEGWRGNLDLIYGSSGEKRWTVMPEQLGQRWFRWAVYERQGGRFLVNSGTFALPESSGGRVSLEVTLPTGAPSVPPAPTATPAPRPGGGRATGSGGATPPRPAGQATPGATPAATPGAPLLPRTGEEPEEGRLLFVGLMMILVGVGFWRVSRRRWV